MLEDSTWELYLEKFCRYCKHRDIPDHEEPCYGCLAISCMQSVKQPINFEITFEEDKK